MLRSEKGLDRQSESPRVKESERGRDLEKDPVEKEMILETDLWNRAVEEVTRWTLGIDLEGMILEIDPDHEEMILGIDLKEMKKDIAVVQDHQKELTIDQDIGPDRAKLRTDQEWWKQEDE